MFRMQGRTVFGVNEKGERKGGGQVLWMVFESADEHTSGSTTPYA
jgi:hypothetical protein